MSITEKSFGKLPSGEEIFLYTITNKNGAHVSIQTLGAGIQSVFVPDKSGALGDVVLGFDDPKYYTDPDLGYQGLVVGRVANRIRDAKFKIDGKEYKTPNNQGNWTLHSGGRFSFTPWEIESKNEAENSITLKRFSPNGEDGFPGNFTMTVKYTFTEDNTLRLEYGILSDEKPLPRPPTMHISTFRAKQRARLKIIILKLTPQNSPKRTTTNCQRASSASLPAQ